VHCSMVHTGSFAVIALHTLYNVVCTMDSTLLYGAWSVGGISHALHRDSAAHCCVLLCVLWTLRCSTVCSSFHSIPYCTAVACSLRRHTIACARFFRVHNILCTPTLPRTVRLLTLTESHHTADIGTTRASRTPTLSSPSGPRSPTAGATRGR
jgi:hypothetical protein